MSRFLAFGLSFAVGLGAATARADAQDGRAYLSGFQSGRLIAADPKTGNILHAIPVQDDAGIAAVASRARDGRLFVVDGDLTSRLRVLDPETFSVLQERPFQNRVLRFGNERLLHLSRDGNWLFVHTYNYRDARNGIQVFDVNQGAFTAELRNLSCAEPLLISAPEGTVFALCPGRIQALTPEANSRGAFAEQASALIHVKGIAAAAATPDGRHVYAVGTAEPRGDWQFIHWDRVTGALDARSLAAALDVSESALGRGRWAWLGLTPDARQLVLVRDADAWVINRESLKPSAHFKLPSTAVDADFIPGSGNSLLTVHLSPEDNALRLVTTNLSGETTQAVQVRTNSRNIPAISFAAGPGD